MTTDGASEEAPGSSVVPALALKLTVLGMPGLFVPYLGLCCLPMFPVGLGLSIFCLLNKEMRSRGVEFPVVALLLSPIAFLSPLVRALVFHD